MNTLLSGQIIKNQATTAKYCAKHYKKRVNTKACKTKINQAGHGSPVGLLATFEAKSAVI